MHQLTISHLTYSYKISSLRSFPFSCLSLPQFRFINISVYIFLTFKCSQFISQFIYPPLILFFPASFLSCLRFISISVHIYNVSEATLYISTFISSFTSSTLLFFSSSFFLSLPSSVYQHIYTSFHSSYLPGFSAGNHPIYPAPSFLFIPPLPSPSPDYKFLSPPA